MNTYIANVKPVQEFVSFIKERIHSANKNWNEIASAFSEAREMYGLESDLFKQLCKQTRFSKSKAVKLAQIANSERLKKYAVKLAAVHSWGTLYAISALSDEKFELLKKKYQFDEKENVSVFLTQADVESVRKGPKVPSFFKNYAVIQIDEDALRGDLLTHSDLEKLHAAMTKIVSISSYVKVKETNIDEKDAARHMLLISNAAKQITRSKFLEAISARLESNRKAPHENQREFEIRSLGMSREELMIGFKENPREAFVELGIEYDEAEIWREAELKVGKSVTRYAKKVLSRVNEAFSVQGANQKDANLETRAA